MLWAIYCSIEMVVGTFLDTETMLQIHTDIQVNLTKLCSHCVIHTSTDLQSEKEWIAQYTYYKSAPINSWVHTIKQG